MFLFNSLYNLLMNITVSDSFGCWLGKKEKKKGLLIVICDGKIFSLSLSLLMNRKISQKKENRISLESILSNDF